MNRQKHTHRARCFLTAAVAVISLCTALAGEAQATCVTTATGRSLATAPMFALAPFAQAALGDDISAGSLVGLWNAEFLLGEGPDLFDQSFQQFHSDGTEMMLSRGLPPSLGNVCVGIWKQTGPRSYKLRHMAWNWDAAGQFISIFVMEVTISFDRHADAYTGTWKSDNLSPSTGQPIAGEHFEGIVRGTRITVDGGV